MTDDDTERPMDARSLNARIATQAQALRQHRSEAAELAEALQTRVRNRMTPPVTLSLAVGIGFALGKTEQNQSRALLTPLKMATHIGLLLRAVLPAANQVADTDPVQP